MNKIAVMRKEHKLSQKELGAIIGVAQNTICNWENGNREPDYESLKKLALLFKCSTDYLLGRTDKGGVIYAQKSDTTRNVIKIAGRDGSIFEYTVSDSQKELIKQMLENLRPVNDANV